MVRRATKKERKKYTRQRNNVILIATEGNNKTEKAYFQEFKKSLRNCNIVFSTGNNTDPVKIVRDAITTAQNMGIEPENGDRIFAVFDTDLNKDVQISEARKLAEKKGVELILSNPCFEVWFLLHFRYSTRGYHNNHELIDELIAEWPAYRKNIESFQCLHSKCGDAIENALRLQKFHKETQGNDAIEKCNPSTDVHKLVKYIIDNRDKS